MFPHNEDLEAVVLGGMLIDEQGAPEFIEVVKDTNVFYNPQNTLIYNEILSLYKQSKGIDMLTVRTALQEAGKLKEAGGSAYLIALTERVSSAANIQHHALLLMQLYVKRKSVEVGQALQEQAAEESTDIFDLLDRSYKELDKVSDWLSIKNPKSLADYLTAILQGKEQRKGVPMAIESLNAKVNGYQPSDLIVVAARPGMGKTAFALSEALHQARLNIPVGFFSLEMSGEQLTARLFSHFSSIESHHLALGNLSQEEMQRAVPLREAFHALPIFIDDTPNPSLLQLKIKAKKWVREKHIKALYIDYLQLILNDRKGRTRDQEIGEISRTLKSLAKELNIPIIALSQLSREVEKRADKRPMLSDLRESGSIEQDADIVLLLYRPEYYNIPSWTDGSPTTNQVEVIISKFRNGTTGGLIACCNLQYMKFF